MMSSRDSNIQEEMLQEMKQQPFQPIGADK